MKPGLAIVAAALCCVSCTARRAAETPAPAAGHAANVYLATGANDLGPIARRTPTRVYVPNVISDDVYVIDPRTRTVVARYPAGNSPQHVVPAWDLKTLWVTGSAYRGRDGSLTPIDPLSGRPGRTVPVDDAYNMYFTPDGRSALLIAEADRKIEYRDPQTMRLQAALPVPGCKGLNHADFAPDGRYALFTCEFNNRLAKIDVERRQVLGYLDLPAGGMPQDVRMAPDGRTFYVANMLRDGVDLVDGPTLRLVGFIRTGVGTHGLYPSRDGTKLYVANRGSHRVDGPPRGPGSISVIDFASRRVERTWPIPGGGSPDMGNVSADGTELWLSGRFDGVVYVIDTRSGQVAKIPVGRMPHGLAIWPQPGRHSLGHTGVMR